MQIKQMFSDKHKKNNKNKNKITIYKATNKHTKKPTDYTDWVNQWQIFGIKIFG